MQQQAPQATPASLPPAKAQPRKKEEKYELVLAQRAVANSGGRNGIKRIKVEANYLQLNLGKLTKAVHYDVTLDPDRPKKELRNVMEAFRVKNYPQRYPAFDGSKNLYRYVLPKILH